jgi:hypothetical protein
MPIHNNRGIALLPLILMVVVFGALLGFGTGMVKQRVLKNQQKKTADSMTWAIQSIFSWSIENNALPIWGDNAVDTVVDEFCEIVKMTHDPWHQEFVYIYDNALASSAGGGICGRMGSAISTGAAVDVAFVILSPGLDRALASTPAASGAYAGVLTLAPTDITTVVTLEQLRNAVGCFGSTQGRFALLNTRLPDACAGQAYTATLFAEGGVPAGTSPFYTWTHTTTAAWITGIAPVRGHLSLQGTPPSPGTETFDVTVTDNGGNSLLRRFSIEVVSCSGGP